jgi:hypothetical protein
VRAGVLGPCSARPPVERSLPEQVVNHDEESAALSFGSVLSQPSVLDTLPGRLARAVER